MSVLRRVFLLFLLAGTAQAASTGEPRSLTLAQCFEIAVDHNPDLQKASTQFLRADGRVLKLRAILYPSLNVQALTTPLTIYVQFQEVIYSRALFPRLELARLTREQAYINYSQTLNDVTFQLRQAFILARGASQVAEIQRNFAETQAKATQTAQQFFDAGKLRKSAVTSVQVTANLAQQSVSGDELSEAQARIALSNILGVELPARTRLTGELTTSVPSSLDVGKLTEQALRDRADLRSLVSLRLSAQQQIEIDLQNAYPVVGISSNIAIQPPDLAGGSSYDLERNYGEPATQRRPGDTQLPLTLYANWKIFDGGNLAGVARVGRATLASQDVAVAQLRQSIGTEVAAAVETIENCRRALEALDAQTSPEEIRQSAQADYDAGRIRQLDQVNLESDLTRRQQLRLDQLIRLNLARAALDHALGRGLDTTAKPVSSAGH